MQSVHRQFGRLMKRSADDSQVSVMLKDFDEADKLLAKVRGYDNGRSLCEAMITDLPLG
jgi:hypothetical protein